MRAHIHWVHINVLGEEKVLERTSTYFVLVSVSVPAEIGCQIEAHGENTDTGPPLFPRDTHFSGESRGTPRQPHGTKPFG